MIDFRRNIYAAAELKYLLEPSRKILFFTFYGICFAYRVETA